MNTDWKTWKPGTIVFLQNRKYAYAPHDDGETGGLYSYASWTGEDKPDWLLHPDGYFSSHDESSYGSYIDSSWSVDDVQVTIQNAYQDWTGATGTRGFTESGDHEIFHRDEYVGPEYAPSDYEKTRPWHFQPRQSYDGPCTAYSPAFATADEAREEAEAWEAQMIAGEERQQWREEEA